MKVEITRNPDGSYSIVPLQTVFEDNIKTGLPAWVGMTPTAAEAYVQSHITDLASARFVIGKMAYLLFTLVGLYLDLED